MNKKDSIALAALILFIVLIATMSDAIGGPGNRRLPCGGMEAKVVRVIDGDTVIVQIADGPKLRVRMLGLDAPEMKDRRLFVRRLAYKAKQKLIELLQPSQQVVQLQPKNGYRCAFRDAYGRALMRLFVKRGNYWEDAASILVNEKLACRRRNKRGCVPSSTD